VDYLKEIAITFSDSKRRDFEKFLTRKRPNAHRRDLEIFDELYKSYLTPQKTPLEFKGFATYHAIRKRITRGLINFLVLEHSQTELKENKREIMLVVAKYFIDFKKYAQAFEILLKEEKLCDEKEDFLINMKIQRLMLEILPYYPKVNFEIVKQKILILQKQQAKVDEFQLYFIQIRNMFIEKIEKGDVSVSHELIEKARKQYDNIKDYNNHPEIQFKIIEIIRAEYAVKKDFSSLSKILKAYYYQTFIKENDKQFKDIEANIEYIMAYTFLEIRDFKEVKIHLQKLKELMRNDSKIFHTYIGRSVAIESFVFVFENKIKEGVLLIEESLNAHKSKITEREFLNLSLNLAAYYCVSRDLKKSIKLLNEFNQSATYYQRNMGKEWLLRKEIIRSIVLIDLQHIDLAEKTLLGIKNQHADLMSKKQYKMVKPFIAAVEKYIDSPNEVNKEYLEKIESLINLKKEKVFKDPRLIIFYAWLSSKFSRKKAYDILLNEYHKL
jgi:hypothetical protein